MHIQHLATNNCFIQLLAIVINTWEKPYYMGETHYYMGEAEDLRDKSSG